MTGDVLNHYPLRSPLYRVLVRGTVCSVSGVPGHFIHGFYMGFICYVSICAHVHANVCNTHVATEALTS